MSTDLISTNTTIIPKGQEADYVSPETELITIDNTAYVYYNGERVCELGRKKALDSVWAHPEPGYSNGRCKMIKADGQRCSNPVRVGWTVCRFHGAGSPDSPGGRPPVTGRYSQHLPTKYLQDYDTFLSDPTTLSLRDEISLIDIRTTALLHRLEGNDSEEGWNKVRSAYHSLISLWKSMGWDELNPVIALLKEGLDCRATEDEVWDRVQGLVDSRRKLTETERKHIESTKAYLTLQEANAMMAYIMDLVLRTVSNPAERNAIADGMRVFAQK